MERVNTIKRYPITFNFQICLIKIFSECLQLFLYNVWFPSSFPFQSSFHCGSKPLFAFLNKIESSKFLYQQYFCSSDRVQPNIRSLFWIRIIFLVWVVFESGTSRTWEHFQPLCISQASKTAFRDARANGQAPRSCLWYAGQVRSFEL